MIIHVPVTGGTVTPPAQQTGYAPSTQTHGFDIQRFRAMTETKEFARPSKFLARIPLPAGLLGNTVLTNTDRYLEFWCDSSSLPGAALQTRDVARYGYGAREKRPSANIFQDLNFTFYADNGDGNGIPNIGTNWNFFTTWIRMITNFDMSQGGMFGQTSQYTGNIKSTPYEVSYKGEYAVDIDVVVYRVDGTESHHVVLRDAFPTYVQEIPLRWSDNSNIMIIPVLMTYTDWFLAPAALDA